MKKETDSQQNVLHLVEYLYLGGIERLLEQLANNPLEKSKLSFFTYESETLEGIGKTIVDMGHPVYFCKKNPGTDWRLIQKIIKTVKDNNINVIHTHDFGPTEYAFWVKLFVPRVRLIHTQHTLHHFISEWKYRWFFQFVSYFYYSMICVSQFVKNEIISSCLLVNKSNLTVISNGVDTQIFEKREEQRTKYDKLCFVNVARISHEKNFKYLLETCRILKDRDIDFEFHHAGTGSASDIADIRNFIEQNGLQENITLHGFTTNVKPILEKANVFVTASKTEGHPVALLEAMSCGMTCFCSNIEPHREVSNYAINYFEIDKEEELADELVNYLENQSEYRDQSIMAREEIITKFSLDRMVSNYEQQYQK